ncbi:hypothetical protein J6590_096583 [Homalodisca vitripennis]|nr:hypothetical protein J6590_096583 [Homalodisca vitripennis]
MGNIRKRADEREEIPSDASWPYMRSHQEYTKGSFKKNVGSETEHFSADPSPLLLPIMIIIRFRLFKDLKRRAPRSVNIRHFMGRLFNRNWDILVVRLDVLTSDIRLKNNHL